MGFVVVSTLQNFLFIEFPIFFFIATNSHNNTYNNNWPPKPIHGTTFDSPSETYVENLSRKWSIGLRLKDR